MLGSHDKEGWGLYEPSASALWGMNEYLLLGAWIMVHYHPSKMQSFSMKFNKTKAWIKWMNNLVIWSVEIYMFRKKWLEPVCGISMYYHQNCIINNHVRPTQYRCILLISFINKKMYYFLEVRNLRLQHWAMSLTHLNLDITNVLVNHS